MNPRRWRFFLDLGLGALAIGGVAYGCERHHEVRESDRTVLELYRRIDQLEGRNEELLDQLDPVGAGERIDL